MNPEAVLDPVRKVSELSVQFGIQVVLCFIVLAFFGYLVWWVLKFMRELVCGKMAAMTTALQSLTESNNSAHAAHILMFERISKDMKDGFDSMNRGNQYQREEHKEILENQAQMREFFLERVSVICKVK